MWLGQIPVTIAPQSIVLIYLFIGVQLSCDGYGVKTKPYFPYLALVLQMREIG